MGAQSALEIIIGEDLNMEVLSADPDGPIHKIFSNLESAERDSIPISDYGNEVMGMTQMLPNGKKATLVVDFHDSKFVMRTTKTTN